MNNSTSTTSPGLRTHWPENSFAAGPTAIVILAALGLAGVIFFSGAVFLAMHRELTIGTSLITSGIALQIFLEGIPVILLLVMLPRVANVPLRDLGFTIPKPWQIGVAVLGAVAMVIVVEGGASLIQSLARQKHEQSVVEMFRQVVGHPGIMWFFAFFAIVLAPFMEEMIFRIFIFNAVRRHRGFWIGSIVSGVCFGAAHWDKFVFLPLALGGMILCYVYYRTGNAFASTITHGIFNALTVFAIIYAPQLAK